MRELLKPFEILNPRKNSFIALGWGVILFLYWFLSSSIGTTHLFPTPSQVALGFKQLYQEGLVVHLFSSLGLFLKASIIAVVVSLLLSYSAPIPTLKPLSGFISRMRYLPMVGLSFYVAIINSDGRFIQTWVLVIIMSTFLITSLLAMIKDVPEIELDHARTLGCNRWEVLLEVVIKGRIDYVFEAVRQNLAVVWMTLVTVESIVPSEGGLGFLIQSSSKMGVHGRIIALYIVILSIGLLLDNTLTYLRKVIFRYSKI
jgi:ABC-type nitrate/sulfonate/bicarbonate transport system permease component